MGIFVGQNICCFRAWLNTGPQIFNGATLPTFTCSASSNHGIYKALILLNHEYLTLENYPLYGSYFDIRESQVCEVMLMK